MRISKRILERMNEIERSLDRLDVALITRYPDSQRAAESYDALRKAVMTNASAANVSQQNLIALANAIDDGANPSTLRLKISDLLGISQVQEITSDELMKTQPDKATYAHVFQEVGKNAHPRPAWVRMQSETLEVVQKGYVSAFPEFSGTTDLSMEEAAINKDSESQNSVDWGDSSQHLVTELSTVDEDTDTEKRTDSP